MDKRFLFPNYLNSDCKLTRAASFSELSKSKKVTVEERYQSDKFGNLVKQYSCEHIIDQKSNTSHLKISHTLKSDNEEHTDIWKTTLPKYIPLKNSGWPTEGSKSSNSQNLFSFQNQRLALMEADSVNTKKNIALSPLIVDENIKHSNISNQNNDQVLSNNEVPHETSFQFKKPSLQDEKTSILNSDRDIQNEKSTDSHTINKKEVCVPTRDNTLNSKNEIKLDTSELKKRLRSLVGKKSKKRKGVFLCWSFMFVILLPVSIVYLASFLHNANLSVGLCKPQFKFKNMPHELKNRIYGQDTAINDLTKYFTEKDNWTSFDVVALVGGIGVGKSYTAEIIRNNLKDTNNILDFFPPLYKKEEQAYASLSVCRCNIIRLENLKTEDITDAVTFITNLKTKVKDYCILVLALFNMQETDHNLKRTLNLDKSILIIDEKFKEANIQPIIVSFSSLNNEALTKCIKDAADYSNIELSNDDIEYVKQDLLTSDSGCKGAYAKVQVLGKNTRRSSDDL